MKAAQHSAEKEASRAVAVASVTAIANPEASFPAPAVPVIQRSTLTASMPGLDTSSGSGGKSSKRKVVDKKDDKDDKKDKQPEKRATRSSSKPAPDLNRPRLAFRSAYAGVGTQQVNAQQRISFDQNATLFRPINAPQATATYYNFSQQVKDGFGSTPASAPDHAVGAAFVQDGPFHPPYNDPNITNTAPAIDFHDNPGFSNPSEIPAGDWLDWYEVRFRWQVSRADVGGGGVWTSPEVTHRMDAAYNGGANVPVVTNSTPDTSWDVVIP
ncbi:MAG: hypothetical protein ABIQ40_20620 [Bacteroidia bacterium]